MSRIRPDKVTFKEATKNKIWSKSVNGKDNPVRQQSYAYNCVAGNVYFM